MNFFNASISDLCQGIIDKTVDKERRIEYLEEENKKLNFNAGTLGDWEVGSDEFWNDGGDPYENFILDSAWLIGDENLQII